VLDFARAAELARGDGVSYSVVGPDAGDGAELALYQSNHRGAQLQYEGALPPGRARERMARAGVFVLPSIDEPFPMAVLEALSVGLPCVLTQSCGVAAQLSSRGAAMVVPDGRPDEIARAVATVLDDEAVWRRMSAASIAVCTDDLSEPVLGRRLEGILRAAARKLQDQLAGAVTGQ
jgi:glycosyltransferase involved in cell wall biosynthesis